MGRSMRFGRVARAALAGIALVAVACADGEPSGGGPAAESDGASPPTMPAPSPAPVVPPAPPVRVREGELAEVMIVAGWDPYPVFVDGFDPWTDGAAMEVVDWLDHLLPARAVSGHAARIEIDVAVEREPAPCFAFHRRVTAVRVDVAGRAGAAIGARLLAEAQKASARLDDFGSPEEDPEEDRAWCEERFGGELVGFHIVEVHAEPCAYPDGSAVVCATVGTFGYHLGARDFWSGRTFVFDGATGELLDRARLLAPYDAVQLDGLFTRIRAEVPVDVPHLAEQGVLATDLELLPLSEDADLMPTLEGLRWRWSPYRHITGSIDVVVPWDVLETVRVR
jgi:hypothetical protein